MVTSEQFDWRNYLVFGTDYQRELAEYLSRNPDETQDSKQSMMAHFDYQIAQVNRISEALDEISLIPEVQQLIKEGHRLGIQRLQDAAKEWPDDPVRQDTRIHLSLRAGGSLMGGSQGASYDFLGNVLGAELEALVDIRIKDQNGGNGNSLQAALIHELAHAADPNLTLEAEKNDRANAATTALNQLLHDYPAYRAEYERSGTLAGYQIKPMLSPMKLDDFDRAFRLVQDSSSIILGGENLKEETDDSVSRLYSQYSPEERERHQSEERVSTYFENAYQRAYNVLVAERYERPVIEYTNGIAGRYFGLPPSVTDYQNYGIRLPRDERCELDFSSPLYSELKPCLDKIDAPIIVSPSELAPTIQCSTEDLLSQTCEALKANGVQNQPICDPVAPSRVDSTNASCRSR